MNLSRIRTLEALPNAELAVVLRSGITLRASRSYAERLRLALGVIQPLTALKDEKEFDPQRI